MNWKGLVLAACAALLATPLAAQTISRTCDYKGQGKLGPLKIDFDEATRSLTVTTHEGKVWKYRDGVTGPIGQSLVKDDDLGPVEQFVKLTPDKVEVGFRWPDDGMTGHLAYFDRDSLLNPAKTCLWHSLWNFAEG